MKSKIDCPVCNGKATLQTERKIRKYRGEDFEVYEHSYKCGKCNYTFTNDEADNYNVNMVHNKYREQYGIPSPEQLIFIRESYGLSQTKMSEILGFGPNQYRLYEAGDIPLGGNTTVLNLIIEPREFKNILEKKKEILNKTEKVKVLLLIDRLINIDFSNNLKNLLFPQNTIPNSFTGFKLPSFKKFSYMVNFFLPNAPFKTRLNKLLSFSDFAHFKYFGSSISGCKYAAIDMGTVPDQYAMIFGFMESEGYVKTESVSINGNEVDKFVSLKTFDPILFTESEINIMHFVLDKFKSKSTLEITNISHQELGWIENEKSKSLINYAIYAPQLKAV